MFLSVVSTFEHAIPESNKDSKFEYDFLLCAATYCEGHTHKVDVRALGLRV